MAKRMTQRERERQERYWRAVNYAADTGLDVAFSNIIAYTFERDAFDVKADIDKQRRLFDALSK